MLPSIFEICTPRGEIPSGELSLDLFAAKLKLVVDGNAPKVYQDPELFFANTVTGITTYNLWGEITGRIGGYSLHAVNEACLK